MISPIPRARNPSPVATGVPSVVVCKARLLKPTSGCGSARTGHRFRCVPVSDTVPCRPCRATWGSATVAPVAREKRRTTNEERCARKRPQAGGKIRGKTIELDTITARMRETKPSSRNSDRGASVVLRETILYAESIAMFARMSRILTKLSRDRRQSGRIRRISR